MAGTGEAIDPTGGSAATQGDLWAERARDWAEVMEGWNGWGVPRYRQVLGVLESLAKQRGCAHGSPATSRSSKSTPT